MFIAVLAADQTYSHLWGIIQLTSTALDSLSLIILGDVIFCFTRLSHFATALILKQVS